MERTSCTPYTALSFHHTCSFTTPRHLIFAIFGALIVPWLAFHSLVSPLTCTYPILILQSSEKSRKYSCHYECLGKVQLPAQLTPRTPPMGSMSLAWSHCLSSSGSDPIGSLDQAQYTYEPMPANYSSFSKHPTCSRQLLERSKPLALLW